MPQPGHPGDSLPGEGRHARIWLLTWAAAGDAVPGPPLSYRVRTAEDGRFVGCHDVQQARLTNTSAR